MVLIIKQGGAINISGAVEIIHSVWYNIPVLILKRQVPVRDIFLGEIIQCEVLIFEQGGAMKYQWCHKENPFGKEVL